MLKLSDVMVAASRAVIADRPMQFRRNSRWGLDFTIGAGVYDSKYDVFHNVENGAYYQTSVRKAWVGVDNASVAVTYLFDFKKRRK